jgi:hypothetical protein
MNGDAVDQRLDQIGPGSEQGQQSDQGKPFFEGPRRREQRAHRAHVVANSWLRHL